MAQGFSFAMAQLLLLKGSFLVNVFYRRLIPEGEVNPVQ